MNDESIRPAPRIRPDRDPEEVHPAGQPASGRAGWTFLTNHGHVLLTVAAHPAIRVADIAERVGITPRAALQILNDLESGGYLQRIRVGRRTQYNIEPHQHFRHPSEAAREVDGLIRLFAEPSPASEPAPAGTTPPWAEAEPG